MSLEGGRILVVDDSHINRVTLGRGLERQGHSTALAENGLQALEMLQADSFDLILLDMLMPQMDGFQLLEHMKADGLLRDIPVIVISALEEMESVIKCIEMGAEDYLTKPFDATLLRARIGASLEKKRLREAVVGQLGKYVPESVAATIKSGAGDLEPKRTTATIVYTDISHFTTIAETMSPDDVFRMLNEYFPTVIEPIMRYGGTVNQFQGDAMLVTFNVPVEDPEHAEQAVKAAVAIQGLVGETTFAGVRLRTRIGINTGEVIAGNVGAGNRCNYTVHGDAVNVAARLEQLNKDYGSETIVSGSTVARLSQGYALASMGEVSIRGRQESVEIFRLGT